MLSFTPIDVNEHREIVLEFRRDSFVVSFGEITSFDKGKFIED